MSIKQAHCYALVLKSGAVLAGASAEDRKALVAYAHHIGLAFQIQDDILDIEGTSEELRENSR